MKRMGLRDSLPCARLWSLGGGLGIGPRALARTMLGICSPRIAERRGNVRNVGKHSRVQAYPLLTCEIVELFGTGGIAGATTMAASAPNPCASSR
jgi:hypothetical protein